MFMGIFTVIFLSLAAVSGAYVFSRFLFARFAKKETDRSGLVKRNGGIIEIYAEARSIEYLMRMASASEYEKIIVHIDLTQNDAEETEYVAEALSRKMKNTEIRYSRRESDS